MTLSHSNNPLTKENPDKAIWYFLFFWTVLNAIQAYTLEIHADEAYYWLYSRFLDWGYFDHPPMVAIYIRIGDSLVHSEFGVRLMTVLSSTLSLYILWLIVKERGRIADPPKEKSRAGKTQEYRGQLYFPPDVKAIAPYRRCLRLVGLNFILPYSQH